MRRCTSHPQSPVSQEWNADTQTLKPCIYDGTPDGCSTLAAAKPHNSYICMLLNTNPTRWEAFGDEGDATFVIYTMMTDVPADRVNDDMEVILAS